VDFSAASFATDEYSQNVGTLGLYYGQSGALTLGVGLRLAKADYPKYAPNTDPATSATDPYVADNSTGKSVDLTAAWVPNGLSSLDVRLSFTDISHTQNIGNDFHGLAGALGWNYQATGKLNTRIALLAEPGTGATFNGFTGVGPTSFNNSSLAKSVLLSANFAATAKTTFNGNIRVTYNDLSSTTPTGTHYGNDQTNSIDLGVSYAATDKITLGCFASYLKRTASQEAVAYGMSYPYDTSSVYCSGQIKLQ
jgi:hypothetical protein